MVMIMHFKLSLLDTLMADRLVYSVPLVLRKTIKILNEATALGLIGIQALNQLSVN